jgi:hypothetical protein
MYSNIFSPHSTNPMAVQRFMDLIEGGMPVRYDRCFNLDRKTRNNSLGKVNMDLIEEELEFWKIHKDMPYIELCKEIGVEAWIK